MKRLFSFMCDVLVKIRLWGWKGVWNYLTGYLPNRWRCWRLKRFFLDNARRYPMQPMRGITLVARFTTRGSLNKVMRDFAFSLRDAGIPFQTFNLDRKMDVPEEDVDGILTPIKEFRLLRYSRIVTMVDNPLPDELSLKPATVFFWEFDSGIRRAYPGLFSCHSVIGMSDFNTEYFRRELSREVFVHKILYPFRSVDIDEVSSARTRAQYGLSATDFLVFFNFDFGSSRQRKNPDGALRAFATAFRDVPSAKLVFKTSGSRRYPERLAELVSLAGELGVGERFVCVNSYLPQDEIYALTAACDVYISLHRGEGFGLGIAEAMSLGKPVVVTDWSAPKEFCNETNAVMVPCALTRPPPEMIDHAYYVDVERWAEPDIVAAASALKRLYKDPDLRVRLGCKAKEVIHNNFSIETFRQSVDGFLDSVPCSHVSCQPFSDCHDGTQS